MNQQRHDDLALLLAIIAISSVVAFGEMLDRLKAHHQTVLTPKQRGWANRAAAAMGLEERSEGPEDDGPELTRLTGGAVPRGAEVVSLVRDKPLRPPGK